VVVVGRLTFPVDVDADIDPVASAATIAQFLSSVAINRIVQQAAP